MKPLILKLTLWVSLSVLFLAATYWCFAQKTITFGVLGAFAACALAVSIANCVLTFQDALEARDNEKGEWW